MKVLLTAVNAKYIHSNLAVRYLKAYTKDLDFECKIKEFSINDRVEKVFEKIIEEKPNMVAFSCYIWNIDYIIKLANLIKTLDESIQIIYGGPEVSYDGQKFLSENPGEFLIEGEGEETFKKLIQWKTEARSIGHRCNIQGLYIKEKGTVIYGGQRPLMDINATAFPYSEEDNLENKMVYYEASRGCPFGCKYCLSSTIHGVRFLNIERVLSELQFFIDKKVKLLKFVDRTFNCNTKFAKAIWGFLIKAETDATFHFEISADILSKEELALLKDAPKGRFQFEVGVQTTSNKVLQNINRHVNFEDIKEKVIELEKIKNIHQHLDLIAGLPDEDYETFKKSFNDVYTIGSEVIQLGFLKLLKGSAMREEAEHWGMVYSPYAPYEILKTSSVTYNEIQKIKRVEEMVDKYYNSGKFNNILKYFLPKFTSPFDFYYALGDFFKQKGYLDRNISAADYYKVFLEFENEILLKNTESFKENNDEVSKENIPEKVSILSEIIKFDYLKYNKKKWLPPFLNRITNKAREKEIRGALKIKNIIMDRDLIHIEAFDFDIVKYFAEGIVDKKEKYLIFDEQNVDNIFDYKD